MSEQNTVEETNGEISEDEARAALVGGFEKRKAEAVKAINAICQQYKVQIQPRCTLTPGNVAMALEILPAE
jgi:hypothetical protein|tara:strand:+ start:482 stop:694 length:213 start_codon:yes stop_codon:yes gene_type:complete